MRSFLFFTNCGIIVFTLLIAATEIFNAESLIITTLVESLIISTLIGQFIIGAFQMLVSFIFLFKPKHSSKHLTIHFWVSVSYLTLIILRSRMFDENSDFEVLGIPWLLALYFTYGLWKAMTKDIKKKISKEGSEEPLPSNLS